MKKEIIIIALIAVLFVLVSASIVASFSFYKEYKDKVDYLEQQSQSGKSRIEGMEAKLDSFKVSADDMASQLKAYSENLRAVQNTVNLSEEERKNLLARIEEMKKDVQNMQKDYSTTVIDIRQSMMTLKDDLDKMHPKSKDVELGKITVKQDQKAAAQEPAKKTENTNNFKSTKSGNVRKVGSF